MSGTDHGRRRLLVGGAAAAAGTWVAPSVLTLDRVVAATGSCGPAPVQVDWSDHTTGGVFTPVPASLTANDGTTVTITTTDSGGANYAPYGFMVFAGTTGARVDSLILSMKDAKKPAEDFVEIEFSFSRPVQVCFEFLDVDRWPGAWEDRLTLDGRLGGPAGTRIDVTAADVVTGPECALVATNVVQATGTAVANTSSAGNAEVNYPAEIDYLKIHYDDPPGWKQVQFIGIHDLRWC